MKFFLISKLVYFQKDVTECDLSIHTPETPSIIQFPIKYLQRKASISIISPKSDDFHKYLNIVLTTKKCNFELTNEKQLDFIITKIELKLDCLGISLVNEDDYSNQSNAYEIHSARLQLKIADPNGNFIKCRTSKILRNKNFCVSDDISVLTIGESYSPNYPGYIVILLESPIPYFPCEITATIPNRNKSYKIENQNMFPADRLYIKSDEHFDFTKLVLECPYFQKSWHNLASKNLSIEARKKKPIIQNICVLINQINFNNPQLNTRTLGTDEDKKRIKEVFSKLDYDFKYLEDKTTTELKDAMQEIISNDLKNNHTNVVVFVSSHGNKGGFYTYDGFIPFDDLVQLFLPINCPHFANRQKLFFYSFCLGTNENTSSDGKSIIPEYSNIFQGFSTVPGYLSYRSEDGTPYIQTLLNIIEDNPLLEVREIQNETQRQLGGMLFAGNHYVVPSVNQCLTAKTYFKQ